MERVNELYKDFIDETANLQFQKLFLSKFPRTKLKFWQDSFQHCLKEVAMTKQPLVFFLHNENIEESRKYCELLIDPAIENIINEKFLILGWKINSDSKNFCQHLADKVIIVNEVSEYVKKETPAIFIIIPNTTTEAFSYEATDEALTVKIFRQIRIGKDSVDNHQPNEQTTATLLSDLEQTDELMSILTYECFSTMTAIKYQQLMFHRLGDRDYDSFEPDEHHLLKQKILFAVNGPPKDMGEGVIDYEPQEKKKAEKIYAKIRKRNNRFSKWNDRIVIAFIYVCVEPTGADKAKKVEKDKNYNSESDFYSTPIFVIRKCKHGKQKGNPQDNLNRQHGCRIFIDVNCRVYDSWDMYLENNILPACKIVYPNSGRYQCNPNYESKVWWNEKFTSSCDATTKLLHAIDIGSEVVGFASAATLLAAMFTPAALIVLPAAIAGSIASGVYGISRSSCTISDRRKHSQTVNLANSESRAAYFSIVSNAFNILGAGASMLKVLPTAVRAINMERVGQRIIATINGVSITTGAVETINSCHDNYQQYVKSSYGFPLYLSTEESSNGNELLVEGDDDEEDNVPSALTIAQTGCSVCFFGNSIYTFPNEAFLSKRDRRIYNKMVKETVRVKGSVRGGAEVISSMRNHAFIDEILAGLTRSNKNLKTMGISFDSEEAVIHVNGIPADVLEFKNLPKTQQGIRLQTLPIISENHTKTKTFIENMHYDKKFNNVLDITRLDPTMILASLAIFTQEMQPKILEICEKFLNQIDINIITSLKTLFKQDVRIEIIQYVIDFIRIHSEELERKFEDTLFNNDVAETCQHFGFENSHVTICNFMNFVIQKFFDGNMMEKLKENFKIWYTSLEVDQQERGSRKESRHTSPIKGKQTCSKCEGYFYKVLEN